MFTLSQSWTREEERLWLLTAVSLLRQTLEREGPELEEIQAFLKEFASRGLTNAAD